MDAADLYEKLYFFELEQRQKIHALLKIPMGVNLALTGALIFLLDLGRSIESATAAFFWIFWIVGAFCVAAAIYFFFRALWGNEYHCLPTAEQSHEYSLELQGTYENYDDGDQHASKFFEAYLQRYIRECGSHNTAVNEKRSNRIHDSISCSIIATCSLTVAFLCQWFLASAGT